MPMPVNSSSLLNELRSALSQINTQIETVKAHFLADREKGIFLPGTTVFDIKDSSGGYILTPLLLAKANCLNAIATLQAPVKR